MPNKQENLDALFAALSDPTRRSVVQSLTIQEKASVSELAAPHDMALPSFMQHLKVLEDAGLITSRKQGRSRMVSIRPEQLAEVQGWIEHQTKVWKRRFDRLEKVIDEMEDDDE